MESIQTLLDHELAAEEITKITTIVTNTENVLGLHELRTRQSGYMRFIQLHIELDDHLTLFQAHAIADNVETNLLREFANTEVLIHQDPISIVKTKNDKYKREL